MKGLTVTTSNFRSSKSAAAYRSPVLPMSPRLPSPIESTSFGISDIVRYRVSHPVDPIASKKARFGLYAQTRSLVASMMAVMNLMMPSDSAFKDCGSLAGSTSSPTQRRERFCSWIERRRSVKLIDTWEKEFHAEAAENNL